MVYTSDPQADVFWNELHVADFGLFWGGFLLVPPRTNKRRRARNGLVEHEPGEAQHVIFSESSWKEGGFVEEIARSTPLPSQL
jgi:hypothetical protein